jgi:hypothetical protein
MTLTMYFNIKTYYEAKNPSLTATYDSKGEAALAWALDKMWDEGHVKRVERQVKFPLYKDDKHAFDHIVDFVVTLKNGREEVREFKGNYEGQQAYERWLTKIRLWPSNYPGIPYYTVKEGRRRKHQLYSLGDILGTMEVRLTHTQPQEHSTFEVFGAWLVHSVAKFIIK